MYKINVGAWSDNEKGPMQVVSGQGGWSGFLVAADEKLDEVLQKARFWDKHVSTPLNERQRLMLNKLHDGFVGKVTSSK